MIEQNEMLSGLCAFCWVLEWKTTKIFCVCVCVNPSNTVNDTTPLSMGVINKYIFFSSQGQNRLSAAVALAPLIFFPTADDSPSNNTDG